MHELLFYKFFCNAKNEQFTPQAQDRQFHGECGPDIYSSWMYNFTCPSLIRFDQSQGNYDVNS